MLAGNTACVILQYINKVLDLVSAHGSTICRLINPTAIDPQSVVHMHKVPFGVKTSKDKVLTVFCDEGGLDLWCTLLLHMECAYFEQFTLAHAYIGV